MKNYILSAAGAACFVTGTAAAVEPDKAAYGGHCAYSLSQGKAMPTDCSVSMKNPADAKTYCFGSEDARKKFTADLRTNKTAADAQFAKLEGADMKARMKGNAAEASGAAEESARGMRDDMSAAMGADVAPDANPAEEPTD